MRENRFFSSVVRIQRERGHYVITTGLYRLVRHPGYLGSVVAMFALPFALTSYWALIPAVITNIISLIRIVLEDNTLKRELEGYSQYTEKVRHRLIPGIW
jgi:protein-S-isoprenylcysteine O-methyltransferase Ste14